MTKWIAFPHASKEYVYTASALKKHWDRLHRGDCEPFPKDERAQEAWIAFHAGEFERALELGLKAGGSGLDAANKAQAIYANYLEKFEASKLKLLVEAAARAEAQQNKEPKNANAFYLHAYALGRYSQGISITKALTRGLGGKVRNSLEQALKLAPGHADAHIALGTYHAEIIDKVGAMVGGLTYGAKKEAALQHFQKALKLNPESAIARIEYADGLAMLYGRDRLGEAERLYHDAARCKPMDAMERLDVEQARAEIED